MMKAGIQRELESIGNEGCYFLCLLRAANYNGDIITAYRDCLKDGMIERDCYVNDPCGVLNKYGANVTKVVKTTNIVHRPSIIIAQYENGRYRHFVLMHSIHADINGECTQAGDGKMVWDSLGDSNTVKNGRCIGYRLFY